MRRALAVIAIVAGLAGAAPASAAEASPVDRGHDLVRRNCGMCHALGAADLSPNPAAPPFRNLHKSYPVENIAEALAEGILTGHPQMPEFVFAPDEVTAIIEYLKSIQTQQGARRDEAHEPSGDGG
jgi:mono/diheme cytochrome c family protein